MDRVSGRTKGTHESFDGFRSLESVNWTGCTAGQWGPIKALMGSVRFNLLLIGHVTVG